MVGETRSPLSVVQRWRVCVKSKPLTLMHSVARELDSPAPPSIDGPASCSFLSGGLSEGGLRDGQAGQVCAG